MEAQYQMAMINEASKIDVQPAKHHVHPAAAASPPPSASSSPSHEFSFTISLHPPSAAISLDSKAKSSPQPFAAAIDLSPADEIFFHGHLLPLHLLHHPPVSPRSSTNSLDSFTLPIKELLNDGSRSNHNSVDNDDGGVITSGDESRHVAEGKERGKSKSFSLFGIPSRKKEREDGYDDHNQKRKSRFELIKRFVKPFLALRGRRQGSSDEFLRQQPYSYSGNLRVRKKTSLMRGRRGEFSAPATMKHSPANSGRLVASGAATPTAGKSDGTMEELQAAIQAAIAHCKKSIAAEDSKIKLQP
ncbi:BRI1 kinase inhibitor 1-like [Salvia divinorum]|uniref:BRI1 kinase inhibitor 1-like n=1 Tax=Salvia divinorum TaxID=28513 RepID=A0ABD1GSI9_SALDI